MHGHDAVAAVGIGQRLHVVATFLVGVPVPSVLVAGGVRKLPENAVADIERQDEQTVATEFRRLVDDGMAVISAGTYMP